MPHRPLAIQLSSWTVSAISDKLHLSEKVVLNELLESRDRGIKYYYVANVLYRGKIQPYLIYTEAEFEEEFALKPKGIEDHFVPVLQVKV